MATRRHFLRLASLVSTSRLLALRLWSQAPMETATITYGNDMRASMSADFNGLSYEIVQLYNPKFFSAANVQLVKAFRELSPFGVLRLGGNLSDLSRWKSEAGDFNTPKQAAAIEKGKQYWEWKLTDTVVRSCRDGAITPEAIRNLRGFLDAANWRLLYGLNFGSGSPERAADEAACVQHEIGSRLIAFQIGNEPDFFGGNSLFRERPFDFEQYQTGYIEFTRAVRDRVPQARFAGPDVANNFEWVQQFAEVQALESASTKAVSLSGHYYAMGPAKNPAMNADRLLAPNPKLEEQITKVNQAKTSSKGLGYRMTEGNSCFGGGKPGVSNSFCSALWGADFILQLALAGYSGVNLHGGGDGYYTPIESLDATNSTPRPLYFGMQLAQLFAGFTFVASKLRSAPGVTAYVARKGNIEQAALINKSPNTVIVKGLSDKLPRATWTLTAPDLTSETDVKFSPAMYVTCAEIKLLPYSASVFRWTRKDV